MGVIEFVSPLQKSRVLTNFTTKQNNALWVTMAHSADDENHHFSWDLLRDLGAVCQRVEQNGIAWVANGTMHPVHYAVLKSAHPDYFSLGGDLAYFHQCIQQQNIQALHTYSMQCLNTIYAWATALNQQTTTIALVQGRALGGGFETALAADVIIAEEHSTFGFPEILFGLFPCTGGMSLLARRVGVYQAERMMSNGKIYKAAELKEMGVIDEVCSTGQGIVAVENFIAHHAKQRTARLMLQRARHRLAPLNYGELQTVVEEWVEAAMSLSQQNLRVMEMLIQLQRVQIAA